MHQLVYVTSKQNQILQALTPGFLKGRLGTTMALLTVNPSTGKYTSLSFLGLGNTIRCVGSNRSNASCAPDATPSAALTLNLEYCAPQETSNTSISSSLPGKRCRATYQGIEDVTKGIAGSWEQFYSNLQWRMIISPILLQLASIHINFSILSTSLYLLGTREHKCLARFSGDRVLLQIIRSVVQSINCLNNMRILYYLFKVQHAVKV